MGWDVEMCRDARVAWLQQGLQQGLQSGLNNGMNAKRGTEAERRRTGDERQLQGSNHLFGPSSFFSSPVSAVVDTRLSVKTD